MEFKAEQKYILMSPRKARPVVDAIKKMSPVIALAVLAQVDKRAAQPILKTIKQALANAKVKGIGESELSFKEIFISEGPRLKRGRPVSRGMWHPIKKRMSHVRVILQTIEKPAEVKEVKTVKEPKIVVAKKEGKSK